ncbi:MAG: hypothetical protein K940chlam9_00952 [Chlamydiae bacterium]|nr:hypothetical protein [Chlamydiota bacterium]
MGEGAKHGKSGRRVKVQKIRNEEGGCYIVISCGKPAADGKMQVEMSYEGDPTLASYLLENAQGFIDFEADGFSN